jgi:tetratricopeptide (TPR) repeat protein
MRKNSKPRGRRVLGLACVALLVVMLVAGCAQEQAFQRGDKLSQEGKYEQAVAEIESAIRLAEERHNDKAAMRYREELEQVKQRAGQFYYHEAEIRFGWADLGAAQSFIEKCIAYSPQEQIYRSFHQRVLQAIADAEQARATALSLAQQDQWQAAMQKMNEALAMYRTMPGGSEDLKRIKERAYRYYLDRAQQRLGENDLEGADAEAQAAVRFQEAGREAKNVLAAVKDHREAAGWITQGRTLLEKGDAQEALHALEQAAKLYSSHADLPDLLGRARRGVCDRWIEQGRGEMDARKYVAAISLFRKSQDLLPGYGGVDTLLVDARSRLGEAHLEISRRDQQNGDNGSATLHAAIALGYLPDSVEAGRQLGQCAELVRQEVGYTVAFVGFRAAPEYEPLATTLGATALEHLTRVRPENVRFVERVDLQTIPVEQDLNINALVAAGKLRGVDALIVGQILDARVLMETRQAGHGESTWQDGYRREPNPDHARAVKELDGALQALEHARQRLAEAETRLARLRHINPDNREEVEARRTAQAEVDEAKHHLVDAAAKAGEAKARLSTIPREVLVPNMVKCEYPIQTVSKSARLNCMLKMLNTATGEVLVAERLEGRHDQSDRVIAGDPRRNVPDDPMELPDDERLLEAAADATVTRLKQVLDQACTKHGQRFIVEMQRAEAAGNTTQAVDSAVKYLFAHPNGYDQTNRALDFLRKAFADENSLVDIRQLLRTHCHVLLN